MAAQDPKAKLEALLKKRQELEASLRKLNEEEAEHAFDLVDLKALFDELTPEKLVVGKKTLTHWEYVFKALADTAKHLGETAILKAVGVKMGIKDFDVVAVGLKEPKAKGTRKTFDAAFKANAVKMVADGKKKSAVCKELGITQSSLDNWIKAKSDTRGN